MKNVVKLLACTGILSMLQVLEGKAYGYGCPTTTLEDMSGFFRSPGFPYYPNNARCQYVIKSRPTHFVRITFHVMELEPPKNWERTDYVEIFDGEPGNPAQIVYYDGTTRVPIGFNSKTSRVVVTFVTDGRWRRKGFYASYEQIEARENCDRPMIDNALEDCKNSSIYWECTISCMDGYQLEGPMEAQCSASDGIWTGLPNCALIPAVVNICLRDITNPGCPYTAQVLSDYFAETPTNTTEEVLALSAELGDGLVAFQEVAFVPWPNETMASETMRPAAVPARTINCPAYICLYDESAGRFRYSCIAIAQALRQRNNLSDADTQTALVQCFQCQNSGCTSIQVFN